MTFFDRTWRRCLALFALGIVAVLCYLQIQRAGSAVSTQGNVYLVPGIGVALVAIAGACLVFGAAVDTSLAAITGIRIAGIEASRWAFGVELGLILALGLGFRLVFWAVPPMISHDAYRYVWDAHLIAHGVSPYLHPASDPALISLRDHAIWPQLDWPNSPTIYPPGAEALFLLINSFAPLNILAIKLAMGIGDAGIGLVTLLLLRHSGLDLRRVIIYWWNPIPVIEFVYNAHVDAIAVFWTVLAVLLALQHWRGARLLAGIALGLAVLTKLYPLLFVLVLFRRRDWGFLSGLSLTLAVITLPFVLLGLGSGGFLSTYFSQRFVDQGIAFRLITQVFLEKDLQFVLQGLALLALCALVFWLYLQRQLRSISGILALFAAWIVLSPHLFPWYVGGTLPFLATSLQWPLLRSTSRVTARIVDVARSSALLPWALWLFVLAMPFTYVIFAPGNNANLFLLFFAVPMLLAAVPTYQYVWSRWQRQSTLINPVVIPTAPSTSPVSFEE